MFGIKKLKQQIKQLEDENADLRFDLEEQKKLTRQREKFGLGEFNENRERRKRLEEIEEEILTKNNYGSIENLTNKILEVIRRPIKITSK